MMRVLPVVQSLGMKEINRHCQMASQLMFDSLRNLN